MHAAFVPLSPRWPDPAREPSQSWQLPRYRTCGTLANRRSVEKRFKSEPPVVFFPLDPKKRHLHWATWWVFGSSKDLWWPFRRSEKAPPRITKPAELRLCRFSGPSRAGIVFDAGKSKAGGPGGIPCLRTHTDSTRVRPKFPPLRRA